MVPQPKILMLWPFILLTKLIIPYFIPAILIVRILTLKRVLDCSHKAPALCSIPIVILRKVGMCIVAGDRAN